MGVVHACRPDIKLILCRHHEWHQAHDKEQKYAHVCRDPHFEEEAWRQWKLPRNTLLGITNQDNFPVFANKGIHLPIRMEFTCLVALFATMDRAV